MKKNQILSAFLAIVLTVGLYLPAAAASGTFTDVSSDAWYTDAVDYAVENGLFSGTSSTTFSPTGDMTRGMFVTVLSRVASADTAAAAAAGFSDVKSGSWYEGPINWAAEKGYVGGVGDGKFAPDTPITREQIAIILRNYLTDIGAELEPVSNPTAFKDEAKISSWAVDGVDYMRDTGLMTGDSNGNFNPQGKLTRAEAATVFMRLNQKLTGESGAPDEDAEKEPVAVLPGNIKVYEEPVSIEKAISTTNNTDFSKAYPGKSSEGLVPAGTTQPNGTVIEQQVYVNVSDGMTGIMTTHFDPTSVVRSTLLHIYAYPGDTFTIDARDLGFVNEGFWHINNTDNLKVSKIDAYTTQIEVVSGGVSGMSYQNSDENRHVRTVQVTAFNRRPSEGETADCTLETQYDTTYHIGKVENDEYASRVWLTEKGKSFDKATATLIEGFGEIVDYIYVYPTANSNVPKSALTDEGYIDPVEVEKYYTISTSSIDSNILQLDTILSIGFLPMQSSADNETITVTVTSRETGLSQSIDLQLVYTE